MLTHFACVKIRDFIPHSGTHHTAPSRHHGVVATLKKETV